MFMNIYRPSKYWDIAPRGFEHISPLQFKAMQGNFMLLAYDVWNRVIFSGWTSPHSWHTSTSSWSGD